MGIKAVSQHGVEFLQYHCLDIVFDEYNIIHYIAIGWMPYYSRQIELTCLDVNIGLYTGILDVSCMLCPFISPPNIYMHRKCEVPGSKCGFTARN